MNNTVKTVIGAICFAMALCLWTGVSAFAEDDTGEPAEEVLFSSSTSPDVLLLLDLSGSMEWNAAGGTATTSNPSRLKIAKKAIFDLLNADDSNQIINDDDRKKLNVRFAYMRYYNCGDSCDEKNGILSYSNGCNKLLVYLSESADMGASYADINTKVQAAAASGGTPLAAALQEARMYLSWHQQNKDAARECRKKYVILITDGADTYACNGSGDECQTTSYKRRRAVVQQAKALRDAGFPVFVIGLGSSMPPYLLKTLNWMAYFGGTDNGTTTDNQIPLKSGSTNPDLLELSNLTNCQVDSGLLKATCYAGGSSSDIYWRAPKNDPGYKDISGYAFTTASAEELRDALKSAIYQIIAANYSFSQASIQASRTADENYLYEGSFEPSEDPFWNGHLRQYLILDDGSIAGNFQWDAAVELAKRAASTRKIYTYTGNANGSLTEFTTANITYANLGITSGTDTEKAAALQDIIGYVRGETSYNPEEITIDNVTYTPKLGDVFRTTPITVGTPSLYFSDVRDKNREFRNHRDAHERTSLNGKRIVTVGTNNGQFHAFKTNDGSEAWSFIPPNLMAKFQLVTHKTHPTNLTHHFFIDGPLSGSDVWWGNGDGTEKESGTWKTILVFGLARGAINYGWSSSQNCDSGFSDIYTSTYKYYCGYHALDVTNASPVSPVTPPKYLWHINFLNDTNRASQAPYLGDPWSKMQLGRVRINVGGTDTEKWVGFVGGGYDSSDCTGAGACDTRGKGFFVVDLSDGNILWSFTHGASDTATTHTAMDYSLPAGPTIIDTDNDGFIDRAYIGDLGGNVWRFSFCRKADIASGTCGITGNDINWTGNKFFTPDATSIRKIFTIPSAAMDRQGNLWLYWGTGDKLDPTNKNDDPADSAKTLYDYFYGVKDSDRTKTYTVSDLLTIDSNSTGDYVIGANQAGYRIKLAVKGEKVLSDSTVFGGVVYFTTYQILDTNALCGAAGTAWLYGINFTTGKGVLGSDKNERFEKVGTGIASSPIISTDQKGNADLYLTNSGGAGIAGATKRLNEDIPKRANPTNILYWRDRRIQQ